MTDTTHTDAPRRVLVPQDGSALAEGALDALERLLGPRHAATVYLLRVVPQAEEPAKRDAAIEEARAHLDQVQKRFRETGWTFEAHVRAGDPAAEILSMSEEVQADLVAMTTHGKRGLERWVRGSVAERVLRNAQAPLLLANPFGLSQWEAGFERILVPLDGSERSLAVLPLAESVARGRGAELVLFYANEPDQFPGDPEETFSRIEGRASRLRDAGCKARALEAQGWAAEAILDAAEGDPAVLLAMTTHGWSGLDRWAFGSVAEQVLRGCRCPFLVLRS